MKSTTLHTSLYYLDIPSTHWDIAHIYEHLLIATFENNLNDHQLSPHTYGWINGYTFQGIIFIEAGFYSQAAHELFDAYLKSTASELDLSLLDMVLRYVQAEEASIVTNVQRDEVEKNIRALASKPFHNIDTLSQPSFIQLPKPIISNDAIVLTPSPKSFQEFDVILSLKNQNVVHSAIFIRLLPLLGKLINVKLFEIGAYPIQNTNPPSFNARHDAVYELTKYRIRRNQHSLEEIATLVENAIRLFDPVSDAKALKLYADAFMHQPTWHDLPIDYYRYTGILTSRKAISEQTNAENIQCILDSLKVTVSK